MSLTLKLDTPQAWILPAARRFSNAATMLERSVSGLGQEQVEIEMIGAKTGEARVARPRYAVPRHVSGPYLGDQEYAVALASNNVSDQFLRAAIAIHLRRVDQRHPDRKPCVEGFFLSGFRMSPLPETRRALAERRDDCSIVKFYGAGRSTSRSS
jgi:hypothetical protein